MAKIKVTARHFFQAPVKAGYIWASCDYAAQELRCAGALAADQNIIAIYQLAQAYLLGKPLPLDPHGNPYPDPFADQHIMALSFIDQTIAKNLKSAPWLVSRADPKIEELRGKKGKVLNFKTIYGGSAFSFATEMNITPEEAETLLANYFRGFPELYRWLKVTGIISRKQHWIQTATGKKIFVNEANAKGQGGGGTAERKGCNAAVQSLSASMTKLALPIVRKKFEALHYKYSAQLKKREARICNATHDEINALIPGNLTVGFKPDSHNPQIQKLTVSNPEPDSTEAELNQAFGAALKAGMEEAEDIIFQDYLHSEMPSEAELSLATWWEH